MKKLSEMSYEELFALSLEKNSKGVASQKALKAQEILWSKRIHDKKSIYDDYSGSLKLDDEEIQDLLDLLIY